MFKDHLIFSNNIYDAAKQILEANIRPPSLQEVVITKIGLDGKAEKIDTEKNEKFKEPGPANGLSAEENKIEKELDAEDEARGMSAFYHNRQTADTSREGTAESRAQAQIKANQESRKKNAKNQGNVGPSAGRKQ